MHTIDKANIHVVSVFCLFTAGLISVSALADCLDVPEQHAEVSMSISCCTNLQYRFAA